MILLLLEIFFVIVVYVAIGAIVTTIAFWVWKKFDRITVQDSGVDDFMLFAALWPVSWVVVPYYYLFKWINKR